MSVQYGLADLLYLMRRLRDRDGGCPWDIEQTFESIAPHTLEEAYEVVDCIERGDYDHLKEELGDLLFQVIYHSEMASEESRFAFPEVVDTLVAKLVSRHPHVFPVGELYADEPAETVDSEKVRGNWEERKGEERAIRNDTDSSALADIPVALPSLSRLQKLQKRASRAGLQSQNAAEVLRDLALNVEALRHSLEVDGEVTEDQIGGLLFACADLSRQVNIDAERAGRHAGREFEQAFRALEAALETQGGSFGQLGSEHQKRYWAQLKQPLK